MRRGEPPEAGSGNETESGAPYLHPDPPTIRVDWPLRAEKKTDQPPPDSGASRRQLSPAPAERHQLPPPRSTGHHRRHLGSPRSTERHPQSSRDRRAHTAPLDLAYAAARAQRALDDANQTIARRRRFDEDIEQTKNAAREASLVAKRAQQALAQSVVSSAAGSTAAPSPSSRPQGVASPAITTRERRLIQGHRRVHGVCTEDRLVLSVGDRGGGNGVAASRRPFSGSGLDSRGLYALC